MLQSALVVLLARILFALPVRGSLTLLLASALTAAAYLAVGFAVSAVTRAEEEAVIAEAQAGGRALGVSLDASEATEPGLSLKKAAGDKPWATCRRPWSLMYFTAHGRALPCCIAPFSAWGYDSYTLGDATQQTLRDIWNGPAYQGFRTALVGDAPPKPCQGCGLRWSL